MNTGFVTDSFSTLTGLASVAYGNVDYFREVQNQIIKNSPTKTFDNHLPSDLFETFMESKDYFLSLVVDVLEQEYSDNDDFGDYIDENLGADWVSRVEKLFLSTLFNEMDSSSVYNKNLSDYFLGTFDRIFRNYSGNKSLSNSLVDSLASDTTFGGDISLISKIASNNPKVKTSTPPPNTVISLPDSIELDADNRGVSFVSGYLTPQSYYSEVAYPGFDNVSSIPASFKDSIFDGYVGYPTGVSLESTINPIGAESIKQLGVSPNYVISDSDIWSTASALGDMLDIPGLSQADRDIYEISLMGPRINGLLTFDPKTMSNGDLFDTSKLPKILNADKEDGLPMSSRNFSNVF